MNNNNSTTNTIQTIVKKAKDAQQQFEKYNQAQVDEVVTAVAWALCNPKINKLISNLAVETTGLGNAEDKINKNRRKTLGLLRDLKGVKTVGVINEDKQKGITEIAKPVGVVGAVTPSTNPAATPVNNILNALKGRNSIIISPSPLGLEVFKKLLSYINRELDKINAPKNLVQTFNVKITKELTNELMKNVDLVIVTGSQNNVREASKSGTPAIGVGQGNVTVIVDESANLREAANKIKMSKIFDNATSCSSENNIVLVQKIYGEFVNLMKLEGGVLLNDSEKKLLEKALWVNGKLNRNLIAKHASKIANEIKLNLNSIDNVKFLMVEENGIGPQYLFSGEKLSPILTIYKADDFNHAKNIANEILRYQGIGHSIGIHSNKNENIMKLGLNLPVCRVIVNQAHAFATGGSFNNGLPFSLSMGCGTWQKNTIDNNLNYKHFINITKISTIIKGDEPKLKDFFKEYCQKYHKEENNNLD
jgi:sulfoacetaldehyde dehydrogenase